MRSPARIISALVVLAAVFCPVCIPCADAGFSVFFNSDGASLRELPVVDADAGSRRTSASSAERVKDARYIYYPVSGKTFSAIIRSVEENGPLNRNRPGRLPYRVDWSAGIYCQPAFTYTIDEENSKLHAAVEFREIEFSYRITITLPSLLDDTSLNEVEQRLWQGYVERLSEHTEDIVSIIKGRAGTGKVTTALRETDYLIFDYGEGMDIEKTVEALISQDASKAGREWIREISSHIAEYEKMTSNGVRHELRREFFSRNPK